MLTFCSASIANIIRFKSLIGYAAQTDVLCKPDFLLLILLLLTHP